MTIFEQALNSFPSEKIDKISKKLGEWSLEFPYGQNTTRNIEKERFLPSSIMKNFLDVILDKHNEPIEKLEEGYRNECYKHVLKGGVIGIKTHPRLYGTSVERDVFESHLYRNYKNLFGGDKKMIKNFVDGLILESKLKGTNKRVIELENIKLKQYSVWSTWSLDEDDDNPFFYAHTEEADEIRTNMGLNRDGTSKQLLLFSYVIPNDISPKKPTIADANLNQYFSCPLKETKHGWTVNWEFEEFNRTKKYNIKSRPECIHESISLKHISIPITQKY